MAPLLLLQQQVSLFLGAGLTVDFFRAFTTGGATTEGSTSSSHESFIQSSSSHMLSGSFFISSAVGSSFDIQFK
ncbi:hypothetical protein HanPI659440_Chr05g0186991 [Helianthus annuus]|nr:hypothetical protein HanPI659440_Chr05g0186991 [Helianthus annuus]